MTCKEYIEIIDGLDISLISRGALYDLINYTKDGTLDKLFVMDVIDSEYSLVSEVFRHVGQDIEPFLQYRKWKNKFIAVAHNKLGESFGHEKNLLFTKIFQIFKNSPNLNLKEKDNQDYFLNLFKKSVELRAKNEEQSVVHVLYSLFKEKEELTKEFLKELFAIYVDNIKTDPKYQYRIKEIKDWAINQDFSELSKKYKNIRNYFNTDLSEKICEASVKRYDLNDIAEKTKTKLVWIEENFNAITKLVDKKLIGNTNIHNFVCIDEKIFHKVILVYEKRDSIVEAATTIHDVFFSMISKTKSLETELIENLWEKLSLKAEIEADFNKHNKQHPKPNVSTKVQKI